MVPIILFLLASVSHVQAHVGALSRSSNDRAETCADLTNKGPYFSVKALVGTAKQGVEPQYLDLIADTASAGVSVIACLFVEKQFCEKKAQCFKGTNHSSTFSVKVRPDPRSKDNSTLAIMGERMTFGSEVIIAAISTDVVKVAGQSATMKDGLLLMAERTHEATPAKLASCVQDGFSGIFGLGTPEKPLPSNLEPNGNVLAGSESDRPADDYKPPTGFDTQCIREKNYLAKAFPKEAGIERYSLCYNDGGSPGALRMNVPEFKQPIASIGSYHWGAGLHGISVGDEAADALVCGDDGMKDGQTTPCGAIPDSSSSLIMGPEKEIIKLYSELCDKWDRCKKAHEGELKAMPKAHAFQQVLHNCSEWRTEDVTSIDEVPSVFFNVGEAGNQQKLELSAWSYITEMQQEIYDEVRRYAFGFVPVKVPHATGKMKMVCVPQFGAQNYDTKANGHIWTLGHPLFYQFTVGFSLGKESKADGAEGNLELAFTKGKCGHCEDTKASLLSSQTEVSRERSRPMRTANHPPNVRLIDTSLPF